MKGARPWWARNRRGATQVLVAVALPALLGLAALTVDTGRLVVEKQFLRQLCVAAAKAGALDLPTSAGGQEEALRQAEQVALEYAEANGARRHGAQVTVRTTTAESGCRLEVSAREAVPMAFARIWGVNDRLVTARAVVERAEEGDPGWIPLAFESKRRFWQEAIAGGWITELSLSQCSVGQWWVTGAHGTTIDFRTAFESGAGTSLSPGDAIDLSRAAAEFRTRVLSAARQRIEQAGTGSATVQVLLVDDVRRPGSEQGVGDLDFRGTTRFYEYATIRLVEVTEQRLKIQFLKQDTGPLGAGNASGGGGLRLIE